MRGYIGNVAEVRQIIKGHVGGQKAHRSREVRHFGSGQPFFD